MKLAKKSLRPRNPRVFQIAALLSLTSLPLAASSMQAAAYFWDGSTGTAGDGISEGGTGNWDLTDTFWDVGTAPNVAWANGNSAVFGNTTTPTAGGTVTLTSAISANNVEFLNGGYTVAAGTLGLALTGGAGVNGAGTGPTTAATLYSGGATGTTNTISGAVTVGVTGTSTAFFSAAAGNTINLTGSVAETAVTTAGLTMYGPGAINYSGTAFTPGKFTVDSGATFTSTGPMTISLNGTYTGIQGGGTFNVNASTATLATTLYLGNGSAAGAINTGTVTVGGGTLTTTSTINIGDGFNNGGSDVGVLNINSGTLSTGTATGTIRLGNLGTGSGTINLNGGVLLTNATIAPGTATATVAGETKANVFNFNGGTLRANGNSLGIPNTVTTNVRDGGAIIDSNGSSFSINANLVKSTLTGDAGTGGLTKLGAGTLTLGGINTYTGNTTVSAGTLVSSSTNSLPGFGTPSRVTVANGAGLGLRVGTTGTSYTSANLDSVLNSTAVTFGASSILGIDTTNGDFTYGTNITGAVGLQKIAGNTLVLTGTNTYTGNTLITGGLLAVGTSGPGTGTVTIGTAGLASSDATARTISNVIAQSGSGTITFGGASTTPYTGALNFTNTTAISLGGTSIPVRNLVANVNTTLAQGLTGGPLASTLSGAGSLTFNGTNAGITGGTFTVTNTGGVFFNSALGTAAATAPAVNVTGAGVVGGNGQIFGALSLVAGTTLTPGPAGANSIGTLRTGALTLTGAPNLVFDLGTTAAGRSDLVAVTGNLTLSGTLTVNQQAGFGAGNYELFSFTNTFTNNGVTVTSPNGFTYTLDTTTVSGEVLLDVTTSAVPEPSTWALLAGGFGSLLAMTIRRKRCD